MHLVSSLPSTHVVQKQVEQRRREAKRKLEEKKKAGNGDH